MSINNIKINISESLYKEVSGICPEPLRLFLFGSGKFNRTLGENPDPMGGFIRNVVESRLVGDEESTAIKETIAKWLWMG